jgi:hypothetical protein
VLDLLPSLAATYLAGRLPATLSYSQAAILLTLGLQRRELGEVEAALGLPSNQVRTRGRRWGVRAASTALGGTGGALRPAAAVRGRPQTLPPAFVPSSSEPPRHLFPSRCHSLQVLALFNKAVRKLHSHLRAAKEAAIARALPRPSAAPRLAPAAGEAGLDDELDAAAAEVQAKLRAQFDPAELAQFAVTGGRPWGGPGRDGAGREEQAARMGAETSRQRGGPRSRAHPAPPCAPSGADEDFARALGGAAPGSGGIVQIKGSGGGSGKKGSGGGSGGATPEAMLYKKGGGKKHKSPGGTGGKSAKKAKKG